MSYSPSCAHRRRKQVREALALQCSCETTCFQQGKRVTLAPLTHTYETAGSRGEGPWTNVDYIHALATCRVARSSLTGTGLQHSTPPGLPPPLAQAPGVRDPPPAAAGVWVHPRAVRLLVGVGSARRECRNVISGAVVQLQRTHSDPPGLDGSISKQRGSCTGTNWPVQRSEPWEAGATGDRPKSPGAITPTRRLTIEIRTACQILRRGDSVIFARRKGDVDEGFRLVLGLGNWEFGTGPSREDLYQTFAVRPSPQLRPRRHDPWLQLFGSVARAHHRESTRPELESRLQLRWNCLYVFKGAAAQASKTSAVMTTNVVDHVYTTLNGEQSPVCQPSLVSPTTSHPGGTAAFAVPLEKFCWPIAHVRANCISSTTPGMDCFG
ncbi:hypothetical protein VFPBJ_10329 [Purpureocillium lilacinum]|uniref:Uncharacterized protein n=1 Tax=Purpureocillium lilacinum TaxID=33203 RepID=A0A179G298_PURLI|nr:hypothetical protein VFPBJ_10329 [Purpureocillium lilacinum]